VDRQDQAKTKKKHTQQPAARAAMADSSEVHPSPSERYVWRNSYDKFKEKRSLVVLQTCYLQKHGGKSLLELSSMRPRTKNLSKKQKEEGKRGEFVSGNAEADSQSV